MAEFGDSLVIRILADSSAFQGELSDVLDRLDELQSRVERLAGTSSQLNRLSSAISSLQTPLQSIGRVMEQVQRQADALSRTVITLNVGPALNALSSLSAAIAAVQASWRRYRCRWEADFRGYRHCQTSATMGESACSPRVGLWTVRSASTACQRC